MASVANHGAEVEAERGVGDLAVCALELVSLVRELSAERRELVDSRAVEALAKEVVVVVTSDAFLVFVSTG